jgi:hypothetical protein
MIGLAAINLTPLTRLKNGPKRVVPPFYTSHMSATTTPFRRSAPGMTKVINFVDKKQWIP